MARLYGVNQIKMGLGKLVPNPIAIVSLVFLWALIFSAHAHADITAITKTWTGAEKFRAQLSLVKVVIEPNDADKSSSFQSLFPGGKNALSATVPGLPFKGTITRQALPASGRAKFALGKAQVEQIVGEYFAELGVLRFRIKGPRSSGSIAYAVLNQAGTELAVVYSGAARNNLPFVLAAGEQFPSGIAPFLPYTLEGLTQRQAQAAAAELSQMEYVTKLQALHLEMSAASQAKDSTRVQQLQQELMQLNQALAQLRQQQVQKTLEDRRQQLSSGGSPEQQYMALLVEMQQASRAGDQAKVTELQLKQQQLVMSMQNSTATSTQAPACRDDIVRWVGEMDAQGASFQEFNGTTQVSNLFRPGVFAAHFGATYADLPAAQKSEIAAALQRDCIRQGTDFYTSPNATSIQSAFSDSAGFSSTDAGIAGVALEMIVLWSKATLSQLRDHGSWESTMLLKQLYEPLLGGIWPAESQADKAQLVTIRNTRGIEHLSQRLDSTASQVNTAGAEALRKMARLRFDPVYASLSQESQGRFDAQLDSAINRVLPTYLERAKAASVSAQNKQALASNANWYRAHADIFTSFSDATEVAAYQKRLSQQRERAFGRLKADIEAEIQNLETRAATESYGNDFVLALDNTSSPTWQKLEARRKERVLEVEWETHVTRVGKGPFGPKHPGAVYLNAIYRNDGAMIREENTRYAAPFRALMNPIHESGVYEIFSMFSGGMLTADDIQGYIDSDLAKLNIADTLAGFFIVSYEHAYPNCMAGAVPMKRTVHWDTVTTDGWGNELWRDRDTQVYHYNVHRRHVAIFKRVGIGKSPEEAEMVTSLFGNFLPTNLKTAQRSLSDTLRGLRMAMQQMSCDDPDLLQLEQNLLAAVSR